MSDGICEEKVYKSVFWAYSEQLRNYLYYKTGDMANADDIVQDAFAKLWEKCADVPIEKSKSHLYTLVNNKLQNQIAHKKVKLKFEGLVREDRDHQSPKSLLEEKEFKTRLENAISALPEDQRIVFLMNRIDKKKYREIAEELGISINAIEKRMHKALIALKVIHKTL